MAAIDLSSQTNAPLIHRQASVSTTWQEYLLPAWATKVIVQGSADIRVAVVGMETPADGGAVGTHYWSVAGGNSYPVVFRDPEGNVPFHLGITVGTSIFVASASGTSNVEVWLEKGRE